ncbi:hypothetical protein [Corallococcus sp. AS-1-6]|uniref:hypothetical protein n=1 Tax=Corallococcus sp. AS-1-6 TaxID=2874599 RepID=UPI001CBE34CD|nr:hypothetical protein [Corallococcus sp. AS-1-6]MBZ4373249.1 hypothetical protein [Corallococcus sp. AS-1-6]
MPGHTQTHLPYEIKVNSPFEKLLLDALPQATRTRVDRQLKEASEEAGLSRDSQSRPGSGFIDLGPIRGVKLDGYEVIYRLDFPSRCLVVMNVVTTGCRCRAIGSAEQEECRCEIYEPAKLVEFIDELAGTYAVGNLVIALPEGVYARYVGHRSPGQEDSSYVMMDCVYGRAQIDNARWQSHHDVCSLLAMHKSGELKRRNALS